MRSRLSSEEPIAVTPLFQRADHFRAAAIIIWTLLLIFPQAFANLLKCHRRSGGTLLHQQCQSLTPRRHRTSRKKREFRRPPPLQPLLHRQKCCGITLFAAAWFVYRLGCNFETVIHQMGVTRALSPDTVFEQLHSNACTKADTSHRCVLIQTNI